MLHFDDHSLRQFYTADMRAQIYKGGWNLVHGLHFTRPSTKYFAAICLIIVTGFKAATMHKQKEIDHVVATSKCAQYFVCGLIKFEPWSKPLVKLIRPQSFKISSMWTGVLVFNFPDCNMKKWWGHQWALGDSPMKNDRNGIIRLKKDSTRINLWHFPPVLA